MISAVYQIVNTVTNDRYVGSSKRVLHRWAEHKCLSTWKRYPDSPLYQDFQKYGLDKFRFQILAPVMPEYLTQVEQEFIELLHPTYNNFNAKGLNAEKLKKAQRKYRQSEKGKKYQREHGKKYYNQLCSYNGETLTLTALATRFLRTGIPHPTLEAKKYLIKS